MSRRAFALLFALAAGTLAFRRATSDDLTGKAGVIGYAARKVHPQSRSSFPTRAPDFDHGLPRSGK